MWWLLDRFPSVPSFARDERFILVTIGLATAGIVSTMFTALVVLRDETALPPPQPKTRYITQDTEDSLGVDTLTSLVEHPNFSIRQVGTQIICERAANNADAIKILLYGITRPDYQERERCLRALVLLSKYDVVALLHSNEAYSALVRSLELTLEEVGCPNLEDYHWDEYELRDITERYCLGLLLQLTNKHGGEKLIAARFVEKWLAKQDWGSTELEKRRRFAQYMGYKNNRIVSIVTRIRRSRRGVWVLDKAGLIGEDQARRAAQELPDLTMVEPEELLESVEDPDGQLPRHRDQSVEEQRLRRQHREAMVLNDGTRPLGRQDIIERDHGSPD